MLAWARPARADLIITPTFDSSITNDPNAAGIESVINQAISFFDSTYTNNVDVLIYFQEGGGLGTSNFNYYPISYSTFYNDLVAVDANPAAIAGLTANGGAGPNNPVNGTDAIEIKSANARAIGFDIAPGCYVNQAPNDGLGLPYECGGSSVNGSKAVDGIISLDTAVTYPPQSNNGSSYGLLSTT